MTDVSTWIAYVHILTQKDREAIPGCFLILGRSVVESANHHWQRIAPDGVFCQRCTLMVVKADPLTGKATDDD